MPTKITAIYENPKSPEAFEAGHHEQIALAKKIPGVYKIESAKVWPKEDGSETPAYRVLDMYFTDYDAASRAVATGEASAFVAKVFELATGGVRLLFTDVEEV
ncbi:EthD family reductase [Streptomyces sp. NPDC001250]|uniref:EthD family reductase n=1 Tax=Streptomyces sp. NPDC001250 TaxID=3154382 RepID=UPI0033256873